MESSIFQNIYCLAFYLVVITFAYNGNLNSKLRTCYQANLKIFMFLSCLIFALTYFADSDYFHYKSLLNDIEANRLSASIEDIYISLAKCVNYNYILFRLFIWGSALFIFCKTASINKININHVLYLLFVVYIAIFSYARATLGMSILFFGLSFYINSKSLLKKSIGIVILICSYFFHHSLIIAIILALLSIPFKLTYRNLAILVFIASLVAISIVNVFNYVFTNPIVNEYLMNKLTYYTSETYNESNLTTLGKLKFLLETLSFLVPVYISTISILKNNINNLKNFRLENILNNTALFIVTLSIVLSFLPLATNVFAYRIRYMAFIPICIVITSLVDKKIVTLKNYKICLCIGFTCEMMGLISNLKNSL